MSLLINLILLCTISCATLGADWDPNILQQPNSQNLLAKERYTKLKAKVTKALAKSWCSAEKVSLLMDLTLLTRPKICVEVGVFAGSSLLPVGATLRYLNAGMVYAVDAWSNEEAVRYLSDDDPNKCWWSQVDMAAVYRSFKNVTKTWFFLGFCAIVRKSSEEAVSSIPDQIDFLHLDGDYSEIGALRDVELYLPKVRPGGYVLLSNLYAMVNREQPKIKAFCALCEECDIVATIEDDNAVLFRKM